MKTTEQNQTPNGQGHTPLDSSAVLGQPAKDAIIKRLAGTAGDAEGILCDEYKITIEDIEEIMVDAGYERCSECEWWCEVGELVDENSDVQPCESCRPRPAA